MTDEINSPSHYMLFPDMEAIDVIRAALTPEEFAGYCKGNALKYRLRAGEKGPVEKCIAKANWYQRKLRQVTQEADGWNQQAIEAAAFGQQNTLDYRDPRTVAGVDVSFETEKHMNFAPEQCECHRCIEEKGLKVGPLPLSSVKMILCPTCGNKRCPKANDHRNECSGSNEPGQPGGAYK